MASLQAHKTRRLARVFTPMTPKHHPLLDRELPTEDIPLVPRDLALRGKLNWELPKKARTNLHVMLKLSNKADELLDDFHEKIPQIDEVLNEWAEMQGASPTRTGHEQMRVQSIYHSGLDNANEAIEQTANRHDYIFNIVRNLDIPGRADIIYLTNAVEDAYLDIKRSDSAPPNIRAVDWLDYEGSYMHLQDLNAEEQSDSALPKPLHFHRSEEMDNPPNLRTTEWVADQTSHLTPKVYTPPAPVETDTDEPRTQPGPFEDFWLDQGYPWPQVVLRSSDDGEVSPCTPRHMPISEGLSSMDMDNQDPAHLMVPAHGSLVSV